MLIKSGLSVGMTAIAVCVTTMPVVAQDVAAPDAREILNQAAAFYRGLQGVTVRAKMATSMEGMGMDEVSEQQCHFRAQMPNLYSVSYEDDDIGELTFESDGTHAKTYSEMSDMYLEEKSPENFADAVKAIQRQMMGEDEGFDVTMMMPHAIVMMLMSEGGVESILNGATELTFVGEEQIGDHAAQHIAIETDEMEISLWFATGEQRWLLQLVPDMTKMFKKQMAELAEFGDLEEMGIDINDMPQIAVTIEFSQWKANPEFDAEAFALSTPETAERAESFVELFGMDFDFEEDEGFGGMENDSGLLGRAAPPLELDLLDGGKMSLAQHQGKDIVVLDFWATWCPPCREGLPIVTEVTRNLADKGVVFYAVNLLESEPQVRAFLKEQGLDVTVAMDKDDIASGPFSLNAIPQTVIIDKDGVVQAVHVGFSPNLKERLTDELETLLGGGSLVEPTPEKANEGIDQGLPMALEQVWSVPGSWSGVDSRNGQVYATKGFGNGGAVFGSDGTKLRSLKTQTGNFGSVLRLANLDEDKALEFISFTTWAEPVRAFDDDGTALWTYRPDLAPDDAWVGDVDGDGIDEIAIGFNGSDGVHLVNADGSSRWEYTRIGNVWHVCIADTDGDGTMEVVTTSAGGQVHVFSAEGQNKANLRSGIYANMVRVATTSAGDVIAIVGGGGRGLVGIDFEGNQLFKTRVPGMNGQSRLMAAEAAPDRAWFAAGFSGGPIVVIDVDTGSVIASYAAPDVADLCWLATDDGPLLVYTTNGSLEARRLVIPD